MDPWIERLLASAIGAGVVAVVVALAGFGPERAITGLVAIAAASLLGALLDDLVEPRPLPPPVTATSQASAAPRTVAARTVAPPPRIGSDRSVGAARRPLPTTTAAPPARWEEPRGPARAEPSGRWAASSGRDLGAAHGAGGADVVCTTCGRSVGASGGDRPGDCPAPLGSVPCALAARADVLWTEFRAVPRVSPGDGRDLV